MTKPKEQIQETLQQHRQQIDVVDLELVRLLNQRARIALELAAIKKASGLPIYDAQREQQVLERICEANRGPLSPESVIQIFRSIIQESRRSEESSVAPLNPQPLSTQEKSHGDQHGSQRVRS